MHDKMIRASSGKTYKTISKQFEVHYYTPRKFIHKWEIFKTLASLPRSECPSKFTLKPDNVQKNCKKTQEMHLRLYRPQHVQY